MKKYRCTVCGYIYDPEAGDPENGIAPGTSFDDLPEGWDLSGLRRRQMGVRTRRRIDRKPRKNKQSMYPIILSFILILMTTDTATATQFTVRELPLCLRCARTAGLGGNAAFPPRQALQRLCRQTQ